MTAPNQSIIDSFTGGIAAGWTADPFALGSGGIVYSSNNVTGVGGSFGESYRSGATFGPDSEAYVTISTLPGAGNTAAVACRLQTPNAITVDGYYAELTQEAGTDVTTLYRITDQAFTSIATRSQDYAAGDALGLVVTGTGATVTLQLWRLPSGGAWTQLGADVSDANAARVTAAGYLSLSLQDSTVRADDFGGGTHDAVTVGGGEMTTMRGYWGYR